MGLIHLRQYEQVRERNKTDPSAKKSMAHKIADAIGPIPKLLLTATPLQNSLMELYGLI